MVDISPKALRFARMAAELQPTLARDPQLSAIKWEESRFAAMSAQHSAHRPKFVMISRATAAFCLKVMTPLVEQSLSAGEWDGNDLEFMKAVVNSMRQQLAQSITSSA